MADENEELGGAGAPGEEGGGAGRESSSHDELLERIRTLEESNKKLAGKKDQILGEKKRLADAAKLVEKLGGEDGVHRLLEQREKLRESEIGALLADGRHDEWFDARTKELRSSYEKKLDAVGTDAEKWKGTASEWQSEFARLKLKTELQDAWSGMDDVEPTALQDAVAAARHEFTWDPESHRHVILDDDGLPTLGEDGKEPLGVASWLRQKVEERPHWRKPSRGAGMGGARIDGSGSRSGSEPSPEQLASASFTEYQRWRQQQRTPSPFDKISSGFGGGRR